MSVVSVGQMIHTYIRRNALSADIIARSCGFSPERGRRLLSGEAAMTAEEYLMLCRALNVDTDYFYRRWQEGTAAAGDADTPKAL